MSINSIGRTQASAGGFIPTIWAQRALDVLRAKIVLARTISRDVEFEPGWRGQTLNVPYPGTFTAMSKTEGNPATVQQPNNAATTPVTLSQHKYVDFVVEDWAQSQANTSLMDKYMNPAIIALAEDLESYLWGFASAMQALAPVGTAGATPVHATITAARAALNVAKVPMEDRHIVFSPAAEQSLIGDTTLQNYFAFAQNQGVREGDLGRVDGFDLHMSQLTPTSPASTNAVSKIVISATGGTFTISYNGQATGAIAYNATAATVQTALQALSTIGANGCYVYMPAALTYVIMLTGANLNVTANAFTTNAASLTGGAGTAAVSLPNVETTLNLAYHKQAILLATRPFADIPEDAGVHMMSIIDDEGPEASNIAIRMLSQYRADYRGMYIGFDLLYGATALRQTNGVVVLG